MRAFTHQAGSQIRDVSTIRHKDKIGGALAYRRDQLVFLGRGLERHGDIFRFRAMGIPIVLVNHPDYIQHILVDHGDKYDKDAFIFRIVRPILRKGLIGNADIELWRRQRRMMAPHFTPRTVSSFVNNMTDEAMQMLDRWDSRQDSAAALDVTDEFGQLALRVVNRSLFSANVGKTAQDFERAAYTANNILGAFFRFPFPPLQVPTLSHIRLRRAINEMDRFVSNFIALRLKDDPGTGEGTDLLTLLLHSVDEEDGQGMSLQQLHDEVLNICIGGYETTTNTLSWAMYLISRHPAVEAELHAEVDRVLGGRIPTFDDLPQLAYTRMILDETLRIYSPAYQFMRRACADDVIGGCRIPANSNMLINSYFLHRHPDFWDEPEAFRPERFSPEQIAARPKHAYVPFGSGSRICIGKHFALTELTLALATIARHHRLVALPGNPEVQPEPLITLHPKGGIHLRLEHRRLEAPAHEYRAAAHTEPVPAPPQSAR